MKNLDLATIKMLQVVKKQITGKGFCKIDTEELLNYYKKTELYTKSEINELINNISKFTVEFVTEKPTTEIKSNTFYLVPKSEPENYDIYEEWIYVNKSWEKIGSTQIDLSDYDKASVVTEKITALKTELEKKIEQNSTTIELNLENIETNKQNIASNTADIASLKTKNSTNEKMINEMNSQVLELENSNLALDSGLKSISEKTNVLEDNQQSIASELEQIEKNQQIGQENISNLESSLKDQEESIDILERESHTHINKEALDSINLSRIEGWDAKQSALEYEDIPTKNSKKVMTSGAIYDALVSVGGGQFRRLTYEFSLNDPRWKIKNEGFWGNSLTMENDNFVPWSEAEIKDFMNAGFGDSSYYELEFNAEDIVGHYIMSDLYYNYLPVLNFVSYTGTDNLVKLPYTEHGLIFSTVNSCAFKGNLNIESVALTRHYSTIKEEAFSGCSSLKIISLGKKIATIEKNAFYNCTSLTDVYFAGSEDDWQLIIIETEGNECLINATKHFETVRIDAEFVTTDYTFEIIDGEESKGKPVDISNIDANVYCEAGLIKVTSDFPFSGYFNVILDLSSVE